MKRAVLFVAIALVASACIETASVDDVADSSTSIPGLAPSSSTTAMAGEAETTTTTVRTWTPDENFSMSFLARVDNVLPHDRGAFTQGLAIRDGLFYESTGIRGESSVRIVNPTTGEVLAQADLPDRYFGEGLEVVGDRIVQLTWQSEVAFIWDAYTLAPLGEYEYEGEGWGLCSRDDQFIMSNGSSTLTVRDLETFEPLDTIEVRFHGEPVENLNELECTASWIYANVWKSDEIVVIDPETGFVIGRIFTHLLREAVSDEEGIDVLNGIAYDPLSDTYFLTGKYWPDMFQVHLSQMG